MARDRFAALARMNFSSPYVLLPQRLTVAQNLRIYGHLYNVPEAGAAHPRAGGGAGPHRAAGPAHRPAFRRAEDAGRPGQGADQPPGAAAAGRADRQPRPRQRRLGALLAGALPGGERVHHPACLAQHGGGGAALLRRADAEDGPHRGPRQPARFARPLWAGGPGGGVPGHRARPRHARWPSMPDGRAAAGPAAGKTAEATA